MDAIGKPFDPELHDAITCMPAPDDSMKGAVLDEVEKVTFLHDRYCATRKWWSVNDPGENHSRLRHGQRDYYEVLGVQKSSSKPISKGLPSDGHEIPSRQKPRR